MLLRIEGMSSLVRTIGNLLMADAMAGIWTRTACIPISAVLAFKSESTEMERWYREHQWWLIAFRDVFSFSYDYPLFFNGAFKIAFIAFIPDILDRMSQKND